MTAAVGTELITGSSRGTRDTWLGRAGTTVALAVVYFLMARVGTELASISVVSAIWPAAGVALAGLVFLGPSAWPGIAVGGFLEVASQGVPVPVALGVAAGQTLAPLAAVFLLRAVRFDPGLSRAVDVLVLVAVGGFLSNLVTALIGPALLLASGFLTASDWPLAAFVWWVGDVIGVLTVAPLVFLFFSRLSRRRRRGPAQSRPGEWILILVVTAVACGLLFGTSLPLVFLVFPFALWAALRLGVPGAAGANLVVAIVAVWTTVEGEGPFAELASTVRLVSLQSFNATIVITSLLLAALVSERQAALDDVRRSRTRLVQAADAERRRLERDLHDGAQQRLLSASYALGSARARLAATGDAELSRALEGAVGELQSAQAELRSLARGIHPATLAQQGLAAALEGLAELAPIPVEVTAPPDRYPAVVEATAYFIACEALTNVSKHARARSASVRVHRQSGRLVVVVRDDGIGGADRSRGSGITGLEDRAAALNGTLTLTSEPGRGTTLRAEVPCAWS